MPIIDTFTPANTFVLDRVLNPVCVRFNLQIFDRIIPEIMYEVVPQAFQESFQS